MRASLRLCVCIRYKGGVRGPGKRSEAWANEGGKTGAGLGVQKMEGSVGIREAGNRFGGGGGGGV